MLATANGIITFDAADYAPDATKQYRALFEETGRKIYYAGPLIPQGVEDTSKDPRSEKISQFLDEKLASHGERSVIYVSMTRPWHVHPARSDSDTSTWSGFIWIHLLADGQRQVVGGPRCHHGA